MRTYGFLPEQLDAMWVSLRAGESLSRIARHHGAPMQHVRRYFAQTGGVQPRPAGRSPRHLTAVEREEISRGLAAGESFREIGVRLGRSHTTVGREVGRNGGRGRYRCGPADVAAYERGRRPKPSKLATSAALRAQVEAWLELDWSPQQIARRLPHEHPASVGMRVSHETIYLSLFQPARRALRRGLHRHLRTGRVMRLPKIARQPTGRGQIRNMVLIADRPAEVENRAVPGHWEGDLVMGRRPSAVATLVERTSRYVRLVALPNGIKAGPVRAALAADLQAVPAQLRRTLTWNRGREMAEHGAFTSQTGCQVYFCDPRSPWQRGSNENMNRSLRQYLDKNADLRTFDQADLNAIADRLNNRPRAVLGWRTPAESLRSGARQGSSSACHADPSGATIR